MSLGPVERTDRGFEIVKFQDRYDVPCSLQMSSLADCEKPGTSAVWFGTDDARPQVMASQAHILGLKTEETCGWVPYPIPAIVSLKTRAHLSRDQVSALVRHLQSWLSTGTFSYDEPTAD
jgi:hypothetical protein